jgi:hypothetical protein
MEPILVQMATDEWTMQALHLACAIARNNDTQVALLRLIQLEHASYLGTCMGDRQPNHDEYQRLREYAATAEDYGIELTVQSMQCLTLLDAVVQAAEQLNAQLVFAHVADSRIPYWHQAQVWNLERRLHSEGRQLFTLEKPVTVNWRPPTTKVELVADR